MSETLPAWTTPATQGRVLGTVGVGGGGVGLALPELSNLDYYSYVCKETYLLDIFDSLCKRGSAVALFISNLH